MSDVTRGDLEAMEARLMARMNDTEARLMARMNDNHETLLERMRINETAVAALTEVARGTNTALASISTLLTAIVGSQTDLGRRVTDLEKR